MPRIERPTTPLPEASDSPQAAPLRRYVSPRLTGLGSVRDLTRGGTLGLEDSANPNSQGYPPTTP